MVGGGLVAGGLVGGTLVGGTLVGETPVGKGRVAVVVSDRRVVVGSTVPVVARVGVGMSGVAV